jgi:hypothetical protein
VWGDRVGRRVAGWLLSGVGEVEVVRWRRLLSLSVRDGVSALAR